ncbi:MAG: hypothetical protein C0425_03595 [Chlorobiaceae bacterium]|nr:hypothetical protein [Chlorobiaceae bacterium]MBA4309399.1 hypothetical protein [Chlorobiaceae bacterium]
MKKILNIFFLSLTTFIFCASAINPQNNSSKNYSNEKEDTWQLVNAPIKSSLKNIIMNEKGEGIILSQYLITNKTKNWETKKSNLLVDNIYHISFLNHNNYFVVKELFSSESELYHVKNGNWKLKYHPFANQIDAIHAISENLIWIAGFSEVALLKGDSWERIKLPTPIFSAKKIFGNKKKQMWLLTNSGVLYFYDGINWKQHLTKQKIIDVHFKDVNDVYALSKNSIYRIENLKEKVLLTNEILSNVKGIFSVSENDIKLIGNNGLLLSYKNKSLNKILLPTNEDLNAIYLNDGLGYIVGENGTILTNKKNRYSKEPSNRFGFNEKKIDLLARESNDEYGVAINDFNGDGLNDIYVVRIFEPNRFYINNSSFDLIKKKTEVNFIEDALERNVSGSSNLYKDDINKQLELGVGSGDIDNDNDQDLYICALNGTNNLYLNNGFGYFRNVSNQSNRATDSIERTNSSVFADVDNDGDLDLFVANEFSTNRLFLNNGAGFFNDVTKEAGLSTNFGGMCAAFGDIDGDGDQDLFVSNWYSGNFLFRNESTKEEVKFVDISEIANVKGKEFAKSNGVVFGDYDNDGDLDIFVANRKTSNRLYNNNGNGIFSDVTKETIGLDSLQSYGVSFADFNLDGYIDLFVANVGANKLYKNDKGERFIDISNEVGIGRIGYFTGTAIGDIDNDGDIDLYVACYINNNSLLFINNTEAKSFIKIKVKGTISNRDAVGAKIFLYEHGHLGEKKYLAGFREIQSGQGYASHNSYEAIFGVDEKKKYDALIVFPASGIKKETNNLTSGKTYLIEEEVGNERAKTLYSKWVLSTINNFENQTKGMIILFLIGLLILSSLIGVKRYRWNKKLILTIFFLLLIFYSSYIFFTFELDWRSTLSLLIVIIVSVIIIHLLFEIKTAMKLSQIEKQNTRDAIARDLHDDLASSLSSGVIYAEFLKRNKSHWGEEEKYLLQRINKVLLEASEAVTEIVWAVSPSHDKLEDLIVRLRTLVIENCKTSKIQYKIDNQIADRNLIISNEIRKNYYLIIKECLANSIKHSNASLIKLTFELLYNQLIITFEDNGDGFTYLTNADGTIIVKKINNDLRGNGLKNIHKRANIIGAKIEIESELGIGTKIIISKKIT